MWVILMYPQRRKAKRVSVTAEKTVFFPPSFPPNCSRIIGMREGGREKEREGEKEEKNRW